MPEFQPSESKTAIAPITVRPSGLNSAAELFLGPNDMTKVATSGLIPFVSTGAAQNVNLPITMPAEAGDYNVYVDIYAEGILIAAYEALEDVIIAAPAALGVSFGTLNVSLRSCPKATAFNTVEIGCRISNPHSEVVNQTIRLMWARYSKTYNNWISCAGQRVSSRENCLCTGIIICKDNPFPVSIAPGGHFDFFSQGYCNPDPSDPEWQPCAPIMARNYNWYFWFEDELGNESNEVMIST